MYLGETEVSLVYIVEFQASQIYIMRLSQTNNENSSALLGAVKGGFLTLAGHELSYRFRGRQFLEEMRLTVIEQDTQHPPLYMHVCELMHQHTQVHTHHTYTHTLTHTYMFTHKHSHTCSHTHTLTHMLTHTLIHAVNA